jgi:hypothetical protein
VLLALEVAANAIQEAGISTREDGGLKRQLAPSSTADREGKDQPRAVRGAWRPMPSQQLHHRARKAKAASLNKMRADEVLRVTTENAEREI